MEEQICNAINSLNIIEFDYDGELRVVEPHCLGITTAGNLALRAYQIDGYSSSGNLGWKLYSLDKADNLNVLNEMFEEARSGYNSNDSAMTEIICAI